MIASEPVLADLYRQMMRVRQFEARCLEMSRDGAVQGSVHVCAGQEAAPVGVAAALRAEDRVIGTYRGHGWALACGVPVAAVLGEVCHREGGINGGRCGSALLNAPEYGFLGENSIVGAGVPIATGVALAARARETGGVAVVSIGDGAMNQGSVHEGIVFAAVNDLPMVIVCENNGWAEMTPGPAMTRGKDLADRAAGYHVSARVVDGCDPLAVWEAAQWALAEAREGRGPVLLECKTVRLWGHYNKDIEHYRPAGDAESARERDPLLTARRRLLEDGACSEADLDAVAAGVQREIDEATAAVRAMPEPDGNTATAHVAAAGPWRAAVTGTPGAGPVTELTYQRAINHALIRELESRPELLVYGEDVGNAGGIFGVTRGLQKRFGAHRVFDTPISESAILGSALGASMQGLRPMVEIMWGDFLLVALDQLINQAANLRYLTRGELSAPMVVRLQQGATPGSCAQHSQSLEAFLAHVPGLKVGVVATAGDAYAMTRAAIADPDPCVLIEARELYQTTGDVHLDAPAEAVGGARFHRRGDDAVVITWGPMVHRARDAAAGLAEEGVEVGVLDLRWLRPLDDGAIAEAVSMSGGRVVIAHEANLTGGFGAEIAAHIQERHFGSLDQPVRRVGAPDIRVPAAPSLQRAVIPGADEIAAACRAVARPVHGPGTPATDHVALVGDGRPVAPDVVEGQWPLPTGGDAEVEADDAATQ
ncbi:MAG: transketolase [Micromonosporaceae bacterium]|nr:transketolase [Micromonosporaceae bacterium]